MIKEIMCNSCENYVRFDTSIVFEEEDSYDRGEITPPTQGELIAIREIMHEIRKERLHSAHKLADRFNMSFRRIDEVLLYFVEHSL